MYLKGFLVLFLLLKIFDAKQELPTFPKSFQFGIATSSYQIEGAWNIDGKSSSIWDYSTHTFPYKIVDGSNGDIACNSYDKIDEDINILKNLNVNFYRFSVSWPRILPGGFDNKVNQLGIDYYNQLINELIKHDIEPIITIYHWELPQCLQDLGGFTNPLFSDWFSDFARVCYKCFGDRVKRWLTINEPSIICNFGYADGKIAPFLKSDYIGRYLCGHHLILGHAKAYQIYKDEFKKRQNGEVGIVAESSWYEPYDTKKENIEAAERQLQHYLGWFLHPILKTGDYPEIMRRRIDTNSKQEKFRNSRLPKFTEAEKKIIKMSADFIGITHYTTFLVQNLVNSNKTPSHRNDIGTLLSQNPKWVPGSRQIFRDVPWGLRKLLNWIRIEYNNFPVLITENGYAGFQNETVDDIGRQKYIRRYLNETAKAVDWDGCNVLGYTGWSLMDNFEWSDGYTMRFGFYHVDFTKSGKPRIPKDSVDVFKKIIETRVVN